MISLGENKMKQPLKEMLKAIGGGHLLNEKKYPKNIPLRQKVV